MLLPTLQIYGKRVTTADQDDIDEQTTCAWTSSPPPSTLYSLLLPIEWIHHDGPRVSHLPLDEGFAGLRSLFQPSHADGLLGSIVSPVEIVGHPVHGDALHGVDAWGRQAHEKPVCHVHSQPLDCEKELFVLED